MDETREDVILLTIRLRRDPAFPGTDFISLRRYVVGGPPEPDHAAEVATVTEAVALVETWLRMSPGTPQ